MEKDLTQEQKYILAKKKVKKISKFYKHLATYVIINTFLSAIFIIRDINAGDAFVNAISDYHNYKIWFFWGIGIFFQALNTFGFSLLMSNDWEEKKIKEFMNEK